MKILQIVHCFPPESMTGAEIYAYNLSRELSIKHKVSVFYRINNVRYENYEIIKGNYDGLDVYKINNLLRGYSSIGDIYINREIEKRFVSVLDEVKPDIVHIQHLLFLSTGMIYEIKKRNIPIVFTLHDFWLICPKGQLLKNNLNICKGPESSNCLCCLAAGLSIRAFAKKIIKYLTPNQPVKQKRPALKDLSDCIDIFIAPSKFLRDKFIEYAMPSEKIIYSDNGMDLSLFKDIKKTDTNVIRLGFIGTLIPSKGVHVLIEAFNKLNKDILRLDIYGKETSSRSYYKKIRKMAENNKNIKFKGEFNNKDVAKVFREIDILIFPSLWHENSPLVLHEAIITKTPVIASRIGGASEFVKDGLNGMFFERNDVKGLYHILKGFERKNMLQDFNMDVVSIKQIQENSSEIEEIYAGLINDKK